MDEAANMIDMEKVDISMLVSNIVNEVSLELEQKQITVVTLGEQRGVLADGRQPRHGEPPQRNTVVPATPISCGTRSP